MTLEPAVVKKCETQAKIQQQMAAFSWSLEEPAPHSGHPWASGAFGACSHSHPSFLLNVAAD